MSTPKLTEDDIRRILEAVNEAYAMSGKKIQTATLHSEEETKVLIDNRKEEDIN